jgi:protein phosphatase
VTGKEHVYTLGAILYRALAGHAVPEAGMELSSLGWAMQVPGGPQLLALALAPADQRPDLEEFYQRLLGLKQWLARSPLALEVASATSIGLNHTRVVNEDACGYVTWSHADADDAEFGALLCVCDGMGGMDAGEVASQAALRAVLIAAPPRADRPGEFPPRLDPEKLVRAAATAVYEASQGRSLGTTITCAAVQQGELRLAHVGDTRAYLLRDGVLRQISADHSLVAAMVASGVLTPEQARGHPNSNIVLRSLGSKRELGEGYVDNLAATLGQPSLPLRPGDWLLLCTDGVWGVVEDEQIRGVLGQAADCPAAAGALIRRALEGGAPDNASAVVARCVSMPAS